MQKELSNLDIDTEPNDSCNINKKLISITDEILSEELKADDSTSVLESVSISSTIDENCNSMPDAQWFDEYGKKLLSLSSRIIWEYHKSEIEKVNKIINSILIVARWVSFLTIVIVAILVFFDKDIGAIVSGAVGGAIDAILAVLIGLFNSTLKSKKSYFDSENDSNKFNKMLLLVQTISEQSQRDSVISDIVRKHFNILGSK